MNRKKIIIALAFAICFVGGFFVAKLTECNQSKAKQTEDTFTFDSCYTCNTKQCTIPLPDILTMISLYQSERSDVINSQHHSTTGNTEFLDAQTTVFGLEELKQYICKVEKSVRDNQLDETYKLAGLRFYYTVYPVNPPQIPSTGNVVPYMQSIDADYREKHSLLIIPTYKSGIHYIDFDPEHFYLPYTSNNSSATRIPMPMDSIPPFASILAHDPNSPCKDGLTSMNHGGMCPPHCQPGASLLNLIH
jgi:hypothetical protein